jgi:signal transduction histidine kinase
MSARLFSSKAFLLSVSAIGVFFILLLFASSRMIQLERGLNYNFDEDMPWQVMQAQFESVRLGDTILRYIEGYEDRTKDDIELHYNVLASRLRVFQEGGPKRFFLDVGLWDRLEAPTRSVLEMEARVLNLARADVSEGQSLREQVAALTPILRDIANSTMLLSRKQITDSRVLRNRITFEMIGCMLGIMISGAALAGFIVNSHREIARAEASLRRERELSRAYRTFVSMVSHQFRTPLAIIDSGAQRIRQRGTAMSKEEIEARTGKLRDAVARLVRLMESTLNAARIDKGEISYNPVQTDLKSLIDMVCMRQTEVDPGHRILIDAHALPASVRCDPVLIEQALSNIVSNALKYSEKSQPVHVRAYGRPDMVLIEVEDQGVGIPPDEIAHVFEQFYRARTSQRVEGTGIGLSFARHAIQLHGGDIGLISREGLGSTFTIRLPIAPCGPALRSSQALSRAAEWNGPAPCLSRSLHAQAGLSA